MNDGWKYADQKPYVQRRWLGSWCWVAWRPSGGGEYPFDTWDAAMRCALGQTRSQKAA